MVNIPVILLAAGGSTRMGHSKPLLPWGNKTLIEFQIEKLLCLENPVFVVLGSKANEIIPVIEKYQVDIVINSNWQSGMGSSVSAGLKQVVTDFPSAPGVLFTLIDQPFVSAIYLKNIISNFKPHQGSIVASRAEKGWVGVPAIFDRSYFDKLIKLNGKKGAKEIISEHETKVKFFEANENLSDMDNPESYEKLLKEYLTCCYMN